MKQNKNDRNRQSNKSLSYGLSFLAFVIVLYIVIFFFNSDNFFTSLKSSKDIIIQILPILVFVIVMMIFVNLLLKPKNVSKLLGGESGIRGWLLAIFMGLLSHGPIYVWYPLLKNLQDSGMRSGLIAVFLYNRAVKIPLLPVMIFYFGIGFAVILTFYMIIASVLEGKIIEIAEKSFNGKKKIDI
jgi:uncharacterized membrane protein YraQ (UPF0718 family)